MLGSASDSSEVLGFTCFPHVYHFASFLPLVFTSQKLLGSSPSPFPWDLKSHPHDFMSLHKLCYQWVTKVHWVKVQDTSSSRPWGSDSCQPHGVHTKGFPYSIWRCPFFLVKSIQIILIILWGCLGSSQFTLGLEVSPFQDEQLNLPSGFHLLPGWFLFHWEGSGIYSIIGMEEETLNALTI